MASWLKMGKKPSPPAHSYSTPAPSAAQATGTPSPHSIGGAACGPQQQHKGTAWQRGGGVSGRRQGLASTWQAVAHRPPPTPCRSAGSGRFIFALLKPPAATWQRRHRRHYSSPPQFQTAWQGVAAASRHHVARSAGAMCRGWPRARPSLGRQVSPRCFRRGGRGGDTMYGYFHSRL